MIRFPIDESIGAPLARYLRQRGYDVTIVGVDSLRSIRDEDALATAVVENRVLITNDQHFGTLVFQRGLPHCGVILFGEATRASPSSSHGWMSFSSTLAAA